MTFFTDKAEGAAIWDVGSMGAPPIIEDSTFNTPLSDISLDIYSDDDAIEHVLKYEEIGTVSLTTPAVVDWDAVPNDVDGILTKKCSSRQNAEPGGHKNRGENTESTQQRCDKEQIGTNKEEATSGELPPSHLPPSSLSLPVCAQASFASSLQEDNAHEVNLKFAAVGKDTAQGDSRDSLNQTQVFNTMMTPLMPGDVQSPKVIAPALTKDVCKNIYRKERFADGGEGPMPTWVDKTAWPEVTGPGSSKPSSPFGEHSPPTLNTFAMVEPQPSAPECIYSHAVSQASDPQGQDLRPPLLGQWYPHPICSMHSPHHSGALLTGTHGSPPLELAPPESACCISSDHSSLWTPEQQQQQQYEGVPYPPSAPGSVPGHYEVLAEGRVPEGLCCAGWQRSTPYPTDPEVEAWGGVVMPGNMWWSPRPLASPALVDQLTGALWNAQSEEHFPEPISPISLQRDTNVALQQPTRDLVEQPTRALTACVYRKSSTSRSPHRWTELASVASNTESLPKWGRTITESPELASSPQEASKPAVQAREAFTLPCDRPRHEGRRASKSSMSINEHSKRVSVSDQRETQRRLSLHGDAPEQPNHSRCTSCASRRKYVADKKDRSSIDMATGELLGGDSPRKAASSSHPSAINLYTPNQRHPCQSAFSHRGQQHHGNTSKVGSEGCCCCKNAPRTPKHDECMLSHACHRRCNSIDSSAPHVSCSAEVLPTGHVYGTHLATKLDEVNGTRPATPHVSTSPRVIEACSHKEIPVSSEVRDAHDCFVLPRLQPATTSIASPAHATELASRPQVFRTQAPNVDLYLLLPKVDGQELYRAHRVSPVLRFQKGHGKLENARKEPRTVASAESQAASKTYSRKLKVRSASMTKKSNDLRRPSGRCSVDSSTSSRRIFAQPKLQKTPAVKGKHEETAHSERRGSLQIPFPTTSVKAAEGGEPTTTPTQQQPLLKLSSVRSSAVTTALDPPASNSAHTVAPRLIEGGEQFLAPKQQKVFPECLSRPTEQEEIHQTKERSAPPSVGVAALDAAAPARQQKAPVKVVRAEKQASSMHKQGLPLEHVSEASQRAENVEPNPLRRSARPSMAHAELDLVTSARLQDSLTEVVKGEQVPPSMAKQGRLYLKRLSEAKERNAIDQLEPHSRPHTARPSVAYGGLEPVMSADLQGVPAKRVKAGEHLYSTSKLGLHSKRASTKTGREAVVQPEQYSVRPSMTYVTLNSISSAMLQDTVPEEVEHALHLPSMPAKEQLHLKRLSQATGSDATNQRETRHVRPTGLSSLAPTVLGPEAPAKVQSGPAKAVKAAKKSLSMPQENLSLKIISEAKGRDEIDHKGAEIASSLTHADHEFTEQSGRENQSLKRLSTVPGLHCKAESKYIKEVVNMFKTPRAAKALSRPPGINAEQARKGITKAPRDSRVPPQNQEISRELTPQTPFATPLQGDEPNEGGDLMRSLSPEYFSVLKDQEKTKESPGLRLPMSLGSPRGGHDDVVDVRMTMCRPSSLIDAERRRQVPVHQSAPFYPEIRFAMIVSLLCLMWIFAVYLLIKRVYTGKLTHKVEALREPLQTVHYIPSADLGVRTTAKATTELSLEISLCTTPLCVREGHRLKRYITRERSPCSNFYRYVCEKEETVTARPLAGGVSSSVDTRMEESLATGLREFILDERHKDVTLVRELYKACVRPSGNTTVFLQKEVFAALPIKRWPYRGSSFLTTDIWRMAGMLVRRYGIVTIVEVAVGVHPDGIKPTVELNYPRYLHLEDYSLSEVTDTLRSAVLEAAGEFDSAQVTPSLDNLISQITSVLRSLANLRENTTVWQVLFTKTEDMDDNVSLFLKSIFEDNMSEGTTVVIRNPHLIIDKLQALTSSASAAAFANYLGFRILVFFSALFDPGRAKSLRGILSVELAGRVLSPKMGWLLCLRAVERVQPACLMKAQAAHQAAIGATIARRLWLARLEGQLYRNLPFIAWMTDKSLKMFGHKLSRLHIVRFFESSPLAEDLCTLKPSDTVRDGGSLPIFARVAKKYQREWIRQMNKTTKPLSASYAFNTDSRYIEADQALYVPVGLVNTSLISDSSLIAFHASRTAVRFYKGLLPVAYQQWDSNQDAESQSMLDAGSRRRLSSLLDCLARDFSTLPHSLQLSWSGVVRDSSEVRYPLLAQTTALALAFAAFKELLKTDHNRRSDFRLQPLSAVSSEQLFFLYYALDNCERSDGQYQARQFRAWGRLPPEYRVNLPLRHLPQFARAFRCAVSNGSSSTHVDEESMAAPEKSRCDMMRWNMSLVHDSRRRRGRHRPIAAPFGHARLAGSGEIVERPAFPAPYMDSFVYDVAR